MNRTRKRLHEALLALILEKGYDNVTVQDILDRADVGRSTFYAHFMNKADLFMGGFRPGSFRLAPKDAPAELPSVTWLFEHVEESSRLFRAMAGSDVLLYVFRNSFEAMTRGWEEVLEKFEAEGKPVNLPVEAVASSLSGALMGLLYWWVEHERPVSPEEADRLFRGMAEPLMSGVLRRSEG